MVYIRVKKVKGIDYFYLVKSKWDSKRKTSTQQTIKYLGKASEVMVEDIPIEYRNNPKILSIINSTSKNSQEKDNINEELRNQVFENLKKGHVEAIFKIAKKYKEHTKLSEFYDDILKQVFYEIGSLWQQNKLDIGTEHVCSNIANQVISNINKISKQESKKATVVVCTPEGEMHNIGVNMIESILLEKGFKVYNISPSMPAESILQYIREKTPTLILISVTLYDNINSAKRLIKKISAEFKNPILLGGLAIKDLNQDEINYIERSIPNTKIITIQYLDNLIKIIKENVTENKTQVIEKIEHKAIAINR